MTRSEAQRLSNALALDEELLACELDVAWDLAGASQALLDKLFHEEPWFEAFYTVVRARCPAARSVRSFLSRTSVRPARHHRCFYVDCSRLEGVAEDAGVVAVKGSEVQATDIDDALDQLAQRHDTRCLSLMEHFPCVEQKIPCALSLDEALDEARSALAFQRSHLERFGELAHVPLPLFVFAWPKAVVDRFCSKLLPRLTRRPREVVERLLVHGLGCYVYYYPNIPLRVTNIVDYLRSEDETVTYAGRMTVLRERVDPAEVVSDWLDLIVRMLALGYSPVTLSHAPTGQCVSVQNAVIDGGLVDVDSLQHLDEIREDRDVFISLAVMLKQLVGTVCQLIVPPAAHGPGGYRLLDGTDDTEASVSYFLRTSLSRMIAEAEEAGVCFDPRVRRFFPWPYSFEDLDAFFRALEPDVPRRERVIT